jgi:hypothetical protein
MTKTQVTKAMAAHSIPGEVTGAGQNWQVELPTEEAKDQFFAHVAQVSGYKTGYGAWVLSPNYKVDSVDFNNPASRSHY